jgi:hypothetical protein
MERTLYDKRGEAVAYIAEDFHSTVYLWEGIPVAYLHDEEHVYGFNGRHLGWFRGDVLFNHRGERVGFLYSTCPVSVVKPPVKWKKSGADEIRPRWGAPALAKLGHEAAQEDLADFLRQGMIERSLPSVSSGGSPDREGSAGSSGEGTRG